MRKKIFLTESEKPDKRFKMTFVEEPERGANPRKKTVHFGSGKPTGRGAYIDHKDDKLKENWIKRHKVREDHNDPKTAGALSRHLLWGEKTLDKSIKAFEKKFKDYDIVRRKR